MKLSMILARSIDNVIGVNNDLPWKCPADLANFKDITNSKAIVMGRNTWDSLPRKPLPGRFNIIITANPHKLSTVGITGSSQLAVLPSIKDAIEYAKSIGIEELIFIGGKGIYDEAVKIVDEVYLTQMNLMVGEAEGEKTVFDYDFVCSRWNNSVDVKWEILESWPCLDGEDGKELFEFFHLKRK